ncbi:small cell adhesion glycoprotein [Phyllostomus discolor]|uniref:Small cell adhesion glycoprotein n=2 Tax=Phyllostomus discolor TaxID=89673 RepID=A0A6J2NCC5_9CHIR|nr:small cell adhesion glycoprotein [Phyllostomus discolor]
MWDKEDPEGATSSSPPRLPAARPAPRSEGGSGSGWRVKRQSEKERLPFLLGQQRRPGGQREPAEGGFSPLFLSHPFGRPAHPHSLASATNSARLSALPALGAPRWVCANLHGSRPGRVQKDALRGAGPSAPARPTDLLIPQGAHPLAAMTSFPTTPSPRELTTPIQRVTETLPPDVEASTALIAVVITVVFLTLLSVVILIFFYLYKNKGSYVTYEPAEGEPSTILQMESDSAKGREKEEYFI